MNEKCFCHFNGYAVKDATARNSIENLYFNSVSEMKSCTSLVVGNVIKTLGFYSANDGGGATYVVREKTTEDTENGLIHFISDTLVAEMVVYDFINVKQFGAKGDEQTDNTEFFNKMINTKYKNFFIPDGLYKIEGIVNLKSDMKMFGEKKSSLFISPTGQIKTEPSTTPYVDIDINNLIFRVNGNRTSSGVAITLNDVCYLKLYNCEIRSDNGTSENNGLVIQSNAGQMCWDNIIENCKFQRTTLKINNSTDNIIRNNLLWATTEIQSGALILTGSNFNNQLITGNHIIGGVNGGIYSNISIPGKNIVITDNYFDVSNIGINVYQLINSTISNNLFFKQNETGIKANHLSLCTINNNLFDNVDKSDTGNSDITIITNIGACNFSGNRHFRDDERVNKPAPYNIPAVSNAYTESVISNEQCSLSKYGESPVLERLHYVNCYPTSVFTNE